MIDENEALTALTKEGLNNRYPNMTAAVEERAAYELETITRLGFAGPFLLAADCAGWAKVQGIPLIAGGATAGSLVAYALGITNIDPIKYRLLFERFITIERPVFPDFSINVSAAGRDALIEYSTQKCGSVPDCFLTPNEYLGLEVLDTIKNTAARTGINLDTIPMDDHKTFTMLGNGYSTRAFEFESEDMQAWLKRAKPDRFEDLMALYALNRPGLMDAIPAFIDSKMKRKPLKYPNYLITKILKETYGVIAYQEQVMEIFHAIAGCTFAQGNMHRRALGKMKAEIIAMEREQFINESGANGISKWDADWIFELLRRHAPYTFNKSHAATYAMMIYQAAYLKANFS
jgi:DNA polymerase III alpha subunit